ncbi:MAG: DUF4837 family protein [candidate division WOR-3 bacterium]|nr:DUF4837 family protein [candidate division WOR-3 bacterium]
MNSKRYSSIIMLFMMILTVSCSDSDRKSVKEYATGRVSEIAVCTPMTVYAKIEGQLVDNLYEEVFLPVRESVFKMKYVKYNELDMYKRSKNILFITNINRDDQYSKIINAFLSDENIERVEENGVMSFSVFDGFARGQNILIIAGTDGELIGEFIDLNGSAIRRFFIQNAHRSLHNMVFFTGLNKDLTKDVKKKTGIAVDIPSDYAFSYYDSSTNTFSAISHHPERVVTVSYRKGMDSFTLEDFFKWRNKMGNQYWQDDYIDTSYIKLSMDTVEINDYPARQIIGVWSNDENNYGGPFIAYIIRTQSGMLVMDGHIYNPGQRKFFKLMETATILKTFSLPDTSGG